MSKKEKYERRVRSRRTDNSVPEPYLDNNDQRDFDESAGKNYDVNEFFLK